MTDPKAWADLAQKFSDIKADESGVIVGYAHFPAGNTRIVWTQCPPSREVIKRRFLIIVAEAGALLDPRDPTNAWLKEVSIQGKSDDRKADRQFNPEVPNSDPVPCISGTVVNPGEASVLICLQRQWWETEQQSRASAIAPPPLVLEAQTATAPHKIVVREPPTVPKRKRTSSMIESPLAVDKLEQHLLLIRNKGGTITEFLGDAHIAPRTLSNVRNTKKARPDTFQAIAKAMKISYKSLLNE